MEEYTLHRNDQKDFPSTRRPPHGLATYIQNNVALSDSKHCSSPDFESSFFVFKRRDVSIKLLIADRSPTSSRTEFLHKFRIICEEIAAKDNVHIIIIGDFNLDASKENPTVNQMELISNCTQVIQSATTIYDTTLDLVLTNVSSANVWNVTVAFSDHKMLFVSV